MEVTFEREAAEHVPVAADDLAKLSECAEFHRSAVLGDEAEPEQVEVVQNPVTEILGHGLAEQGLATDDDLVVLLQPLEESAEVADTDGIFDILARGASAGDGGKDRKVRSVVLSEFLDEPGLAFFDEERTFADHVLDHLIAGDGAVVHQQGDVLGDAAGEGVEREQVVGDCGGRMVGEDSL